MTSHPVFANYNNNDVVNGWSVSDSQVKKEVTAIKWTAIVLTCGNKSLTQALQKELDLRQAKGYLDKDTILLAVEDPRSKVGSGGATVNALLTVVECISAKQGFTVINSDVLQTARILILHHGRPYGYDACGRAFTALPVEYNAPGYDTLINNIDLHIKIISEKLAVKSKPGVWISSTDMLLSIPDDADVPWEACDACVVTVPSTVEYCKDHGVCKFDDQGYVEDILYKENVDNMESCQRPDGSVPLVVGIVYVTASLAGKLLSFHIKPPLHACTYMGIDSGQQPFELSLFFDVLLPMTTGLSETDFVSGERSGTFGKPMTKKSGENRQNMILARRLLWNELHGYKLRACMVEKGSFHYFAQLASQYRKLMLDCPLKTSGLAGLVWSDNIHSCVEGSVTITGKNTIINSRLHENVTIGGGNVITHCSLQGNVVIGKDCVLNGVHVNNTSAKPVTFGEELVLQGFTVHLKSMPTSIYVLTVHGVLDNLQALSWKSTSSFCNEPWLVVLNRTGIVREDLWGTDVENDDQTIMTAKLFPVLHVSEAVGLQEILWLQGQKYDDADRSILNRWRSSWRLSLEEILSLVDVEKEFEQRRKLFYDISRAEMVHVLQNQGHKGFRHVYKSASVEGFSEELLNALDNVAKQTTSPGVAARTLANIADILGAMSFNNGGLRSGPAANQNWAKAFRHLEVKDFPSGIEELAKERKHWLDRPDLLVRAARHYEGAAQILIRQAVMTAKEYFKPTSGQHLMNKWVIAECPARIDLSGAWSDTPPITYEHGGACVVVGLRIHGKKPIGAKVRRIPEPVIKLEIMSNTGESQIVLCKELADMEGYYRPQTLGALLKAAFICTDMIDLASDDSLSKQLMDKFGGGFEMCSWSTLPTGSGLGTSSILAGAVIGALLTASGQTCDVGGIVHAVLYLEQLLTTGGGWQDQVGGLCGGVKLGVSEAKLPLKVDVIDLNLSQETIKEMNERLLLIYTGETRLARNLLQDVIRNWYARNPHIVTTEDSLVVLSQLVAEALMKGDVTAVGKLSDHYWMMKKRMAPGCDTAATKKIKSVLTPYVDGMGMSGAGGGGFMWAILRDPVDRPKVKKLLASVEDFDDVAVYDACVDPDGLTITVED